MTSAKEYVYVVLSVREPNWSLHDDQLSDIIHIST